MNNELYYGDNLEVLRNKIEKNSIDLCYIDPPFNSKRNYFQIYTNVGKEDQAQAQAFIDTWTWNLLAEQALREIIGNDNGRYTTQTVDLIKGLHAVLGAGGLLSYLLSMTQRVNEIQRVLKPTGSFYLHCDPTASHCLKLILDSVFCPRGGDYVNEIIWKRTSSHNRSKRWGVIHDSIFFYSKSSDFTWNRVTQDLGEKYVESFYRLKDSKGMYRIDNLTGPGIRTGDSGKPWKDIDPTIKGRHWEPPPDRALPSWFIFPDKYSAMPVQERLDILYQQGLIHFPKKQGGVPSFKRYLLESSGVAIQDVIVDIQPIQAQAAERLGYPTQKPEALLERIIQTSSNEGDVILDAYCGCGTTVAVAQRLNRNWIGIDITYQSIAVILKRITEKFGAEVAATIKLSSIPKDMESARALALKKDDRLRKEFEKWAVLTYTNNQAAINEKKGADKGIDGVAYIITGNHSSEKVVFQVKSGKVGRGDIAKLRGDQAREQAAMAFLITLNEPTQDMREEALAAGIYHYSLLHRDYPCIQIITIRDMLEQKQLFDFPHKHNVLKPSELVIEDTQKELSFNEDGIE